MEWKREYCRKICRIDGVETYIISPAKYDQLIEDQALLNGLMRTRAEILPYIETAREIGTEKLYLAFGVLPAKIEKFRWMPLHCYKKGEAFYHVQYRSTWMCRACGHVLNAPLLMPMAEAEPILYSWSENRYPAIPRIFEKVTCPNCGKPLQRHFIRLGSPV